MLTAYSIVMLFRIVLKTSQLTQRRRKDVVRLIFGLKDVLDWSEMEVAKTIF